MTSEHNILTKYCPDGTPYMFGGSIPSIQERLFSGKELDIAHGYEYYDFGARHYNPLVYRFTTMDPMAEKYYNISPYVLCAN